MAKVFRLFQDRNLQHWEDRGQAYGPAVIDKIPNPDGDTSRKEPTSIPSPFARIDLVRTAFKFVVDKNELDGNTIYHKLISDCFDVGEMFFKIDSLGGKVQIKTWDKEIDLNKLKNSTNQKHRLYGETLDLFLSQDKEAYNFDSLNRLFFILYDFQIIGGTSPSTMFFTSANDLSFTKIKFGNDTLFDSDLKPLYKRDPEFQKYLHLFFKANPELSYKMRDMAAYLQKNLNLLFNTNEVLYNELMQLDGKPTNVLLQELDSNYEVLDTGEPGDNLEVIGFWMKKKKMQDRGKVIEQYSDFVINSTKYNRGHKPLVLQNNFAQRLVYTDQHVLWNNNWAVPFFDPESDLNRRTLPGQLDRYPYVTVSDFLQPKIIRLVYPINSEKYWNGNIRFESGDKNKHFLLPIAPKFFDYFDTTDLQRRLPDGKPMFEMIVYAGSVEAILRIPIKGNSNYITLKRTYENRGLSSSGEPDLLNNKGYIVENQFGLTIYPFIKTGDDSNSFYRVMLVDRDIAVETKHYNYELYFYKNTDNELLKYNAKKVRSSKVSENVTSNYFILEKEFDYIEVKHNDATGLVLPLFSPPKNGTEEFTFAIDFGTTNTHIEYTLDFGKEPRSRVIVPFEITSSDVQIATLHDPASQETSYEISGAIMIFSLIPQEFLPERIGKLADFKFPQRTIIGHHESVDTSNPTYSLADFNIPFIYEKEPIYRGTKIKTNLKWSNYTLNDDDERKIESFFEELILLIRNKVLLNNGKLKETKLIWFYPSSMVEHRRNKLEATWQKLFSKYISDKFIPQKISESIAPFFYFKNKGGIDASDLPVAAIDIGGGTSDIVVYKDNKPQILTSFRFAANAIFGDAYNGSPERNGFILKYLDKIRKQLNDNELHDLEAVLETINSTQNSEDIAAFLFSIENNKMIIEKQIPISFNKMLSKDDDLKIVFIVFYSSLIYHLAKLMKANSYKIPRYITFSGTGSKVLGIADSNSNLLGLQNLTNIIFQKIFSVTESNIELVKHDEPKEITCKGGLHSASDADIDIEKIKSVLVGVREDILVSNNMITYEELKNEDLLSSVISEVNAFVDLLFNIIFEYNLFDKFGVNPAQINNNIMTIKLDLMRYLKSGIEMKRQDLRGKSNIVLEETLFFYPLIGALNNLAYNAVTTSKLN
jgi:hypothetical protein